MTSQTPEVKEIEEVVEEIGNLLQTGEYDKAVAYLHQQLQKERKEERERIATELDRYAHESHSATINIKHLMEKLVDHSELDQHNK